MWISAVLVVKVRITWREFLRIVWRLGGFPRTLPTAVRTGVSYAHVLSADIQRGEASRDQRERLLYECLGYQTTCWQLHSEGGGRPALPADECVSACAGDHQTEQQTACVADEIADVLPLAAEQIAEHAIAQQPG